MRLPRDISSTELIRSLQKLGYQISRRKGSHIRLTTYQDGEQHITNTKSSLNRIGTLSAIINDIASHFKKTKEEIAADIFK